MARKSSAAKRATRKAKAHAVQAGVNQQPAGAQDGAADGVERPESSVKAVFMGCKEERGTISTQLQLSIAETLDLIFKYEHSHSRDHRGI